jgi:SAM-dependent methyltransferase
MGTSRKSAQKEWYEDVKARYSLSLADRNNEVHLMRLKGLFDHQKIDPPLLEIGCSHGWYFGKLGCETYAVDIALGGIRKERNFIVADAEALPFKEGVFGLVYGFGIIHHLEDIDQGLGEAYRVLRPGGRIAFGAENHAFCPANYVLPFIYGNWRVEKGFTRIRRRNIEKKLLKTGFADHRYGYGGFAVYGMNAAVHRVTKKIEDFLSRVPLFHKIAGFLYFTSKKP